MAARHATKGAEKTADIRGKVREIYALEQLSSGDSAVHRRHPAAKLISTAVYIALAVSFDRAEFGRLVPFIFYPVVLMALSNTPWRAVLSRASIALPFCLLAGVSNIVFDRAPALAVGGVVVSAGVVSFFAILYRVLLCVAAVLLLVATTPLSELTGALRRMKVPEIIVMLFEMTYRYIGVLADEATTMYMAYALRSLGRGGVQMRHMGSFVGQLLIRSSDCAERVFHAMKCRGYPGAPPGAAARPFEAADFVYLAATILPFLLMRIFDFTALYARIFS